MALSNFVDLSRLEALLAYNWAVSLGGPMSHKIDPRRIEVIDDDLAEVLRKKSPAERIEMIAAANRTARLLAAAGIRYQHPDWDQAQVHAEMIRRVCGGTI